MRSALLGTGGAQEWIRHGPGADEDLGGGTHQLQIFRFKAGVFGDAREHLWADFFALMEGKHHIRPAVPRKNPM